MHLRIILITIILASNALEANTSAISYHAKRGRLGNKLIAFCHANYNKVTKFNQKRPELKDAV